LFHCICTEKEFQDTDIDYFLPLGGKVTRAGDVYGGDMGGFRIGGFGVNSDREIVNLVELTDEIPTDKLTVGFDSQKQKERSSVCDVLCPALSVTTCLFRFKDLNGKPF